MVKILRVPRHFSRFFNERKVVFFETLPSFQKKIFLKTATFLFRYFYVENKQFFFIQIETFGTYAASCRAV